RRSDLGRAGGRQTGERRQRQRPPRRPRAVVPRRIGRRRPLRPPGVTVPDPIRHTNEPLGNETRATAVGFEPAALRASSPTLAVIRESAGVFHWTPDDRKLFDFTSGVLVSNLGHSPARWMKRFADYLGWPADGFGPGTAEFVKAAPLTSYNAVTPLDA